MIAVVDNQIRWSSLSKLKDEWRQQSKSKKASASHDAAQKESANGIQEIPNQAHYRVGRQMPHVSRLPADSN